MTSIFEINSDYFFRGIEASIYFITLINFKLLTENYFY